MRAIEIIQLLTEELVPAERCGTTFFPTSDLSQLSQFFGDYYSWSGHMFEGDVLYINHYTDDDWDIDDADVIGHALKKDDCDVYLLRVEY